jgi:molecular chaperone HtpG
MAQSSDASASQPHPESLEFRAEVQQLLHILAHSLYTNREIFLRELISNASDALHRLQFEMLTNRDVLDPTEELAITLTLDKGAGVITISDTGIGMTRDEMIENLGTVAHSGAAAFLQSVKEGNQRPDDIIGQFGVGFYSVFMVAEEVTVTSRSYRLQEQAWTWTSRGDSRYTLVAADKATRGTTVRIRLNADATEFVEAWRLEQIVKKHSDYVSFPIYLDQRVLNRQTAPWRQSPQTVTAEDYVQFYKQLTLDADTPLLHLHLVTDAPVNLRSILFVPARRDRSMPIQRPEPGLRLYSRKVLIQEHNTDLLPPYLRFVEGVVDSEDLPLNISRENIQSNPIMRQIKRALTSRLIKELATMADERPDDYQIFWREYGVFVKEGIATEPTDQESLPDLLRFHLARAGDQEWVSLKEYSARMGEGQNAIYYLLGDDLSSARRSPHLDYFRAHNLEVLAMIDPIDGFVVQMLRHYAGKPFQNVDDPNIELPVPPAAAVDGETLSADELSQLAARVKVVLGERVADVRESNWLVDSACRLVSPQSGPERDLQRVRRMFEQGYEIPSKILELNRRHPLVRDLGRLVGTSPDDPIINLAIEQMLDNALILEGLASNPADMTPRIQALMEAAVAARVQR